MKTNILSINTIMNQLFNRAYVAKEKLHSGCAMATPRVYQGYSKAIRFAASLFVVFCMSIGEMWGAVVSGTTYETKGSMPTGWSKNGDYQSTSYLKLISTSNYIQTDAFCQNGITSVKVKARTYGGPNETQRVITIEWVPTSGSTITLGTVDPSSTTLTDLTLSSLSNTPTANTTGSIKISCKSSNGSKGAGVSEVTITYTSGSCGGTTYTVTYNANNGSGTVTDASSPYSSGATVKVLPNGFTRSGYIFTKWNTASGGGGTDRAEGATFNISANTTLYAQWVTSSLRDDITCSTTGVTSTSYTAWSSKSASNSGHSTAVYAGNSAKGNSVIQLKSDGSTSGIITTTSGGTAKYVYVVWEGHTAAGRTIDIYGKNTAYTAVSDLYNSSTYGTKIGSIVCGTSTVLAINSSYKYIGIRSNSGALWLTSVSIEWNPPVYTLTYDANGGSVSPSSATQASVGASITLPTPTRTGYTCSGWYTASSGGTKRGNAGASYTPTADEKLYAQWTAKTYTITLDREGGTSGATSATATYNSSSLTSWSAPSQSGYEFLGYYSGDNGTGTLVIDKNGALQKSVTISSVAWTNSSGQWVKDGGVTLYAKWCQPLADLGADVNTSTSTSVTLQWTKISGVDATTPYEVEVSPSGGTVGSIDLSGSKATCAITGLTPCTEYTFTIWAYKASDAYCDDTFDEVVHTTSGTYTYTVTKTNVSLKGGETEAADNCDDFMAEYVANTGYALPASITVSGASDYTWEDGILMIDNDDVTGNVSVSIVGVPMLYYRGADNSWGSTAMTLSSGGTYYYIQSSTNNHQFKISTCNEAAGAWTCGTVYNHTYKAPGFAMTDIDKLYDYGGDNCYCTYNDGSYYIIVFRGNTVMNSSSDPKICVSTTLPDDTPSGLEETQTIYFTPNSQWSDAGAKYAVNYYGHDSDGWSEYMTESTCDAGVYRADIPALYSDIIIVRLDPAGTKDWDGKWNQTGDLRIPAGKNRFTLPGSGDYVYNGATETWSSFTPTAFSITFAGNGSTSGSMSTVSSIACDDNRTLAANAFGRTGYTFANWTADVDVKVGGSTISAGGAIADKATIQNIRSNIALTAQWSPNTNTAYTVKHYKQKLDGTYPASPDETQNLTGTTAASVTPAVKSYTGFTSPSTQTKTIAADGSLVVTYQYTRNKYNVAVASVDNVTITATPSGGSAIAEGANSNVFYQQSVTLAKSGITSGYFWAGWKVTNAGGDDVTASIVDGNTLTIPTYAVTVSANLYRNAIAWCDPDVEVTGDVHLTSTKDVYVHSTSGAGNLIEISSSDMGSATKMEVAYLNADAADAEVDKASSLFRLYNAAGSETVDELDLDYEWGTSHSIRYTPSAYGVTNNYKLQLNFKRGDKVLKTVTKAIYGRSLPEEFVIAVKNTNNNKWYAMPSDLAGTESAQSALALNPSLEIEVDNTTTPTKVTVAPATRIYKATGRNTATNNITGIRFTNDGSHWLQSGKSSTKLWLSGTNSDNNQVFYLKSTDFGAYDLAFDPSQSSTRKIGVYLTSGTETLGHPASGSAHSTIYLLPVESKIEELAATATEWTQNEVLVEANASSVSATKVLGILDGDEYEKFTLSTPVATNTYLIKLLDDSDDKIDYTDNDGQTLQFKWYDSSDKLKAYSWVTVPSIIAAGSNDEWSDFVSAPTLSDIVVLSKPMTVNVTDAQAKRVVIDKSGSKTGQLDISAGKELVVAETVRKFDGTTFGATGESDINFGSDKTNGLGALVMGTHDGTNKATVNFYSKSHGAKNSNESVNQFVGTPFNDETNVLYNWYNSWIYEFTNTSGTPSWKRIKDGDGMTPFHGYCIISADNEQNPGHMYWQQGTLVTSADQSLTLAYYNSENTENMFANSWMAPIKISEMNGNMDGTTGTVYIFNSGSEKDGDGSKNDGSAGNYSSYTPGTAGSNVIPAMQAFTVYATAAGSLSLDYSAYVYDPAVAGTTPVANKAPQRTGTAADEMEHLKLRVASESGWGDALDIYIREDFGYGFELYYDGPKIEGDELAPMLYAVTDDGKMAINCVPDAEGTVVGFRRGEDDYCQFTFEYDGDETLYLNDLKEQVSTLISADKSYSFYSAAGDMQARFIISRTPIRNTPTGVENTDVRNQKSDVRKLVIDDHVFIIRNGQMYDVTGKRVTDINK